MIPKTGIVLVKFEAAWCCPCKSMISVIDRIAEKYSNITVVKIDADENPELTSQCGVRSLPTLILFKDGNIVNGITGLTTQDRIEKMIQEAQ